MIKAFLVKLVISFAILSVLFLALRNIEGLKREYLVLIVVGATIILSPRIKKVNSQAGEKYHLTWFFLKNPIEF